MKPDSKPTIFVVEDNLLYQHLIAKELEAVNGDIHFFTNGEACISELHKNPSVIVLDYNLDGKINGLDTLQFVRKKKPGIPAILFSSQRGIYSKENLLRYGYFDFIEKCEHSFQVLRQMIQRKLRIPSFA
ncbi:MAG: response regulator [Bacteroidetes bacterium]|nr:response regulator [Bacteroidota bacterium]